MLIWLPLCGLISVYFHDAKWGLIIFFIGISLYLYGKDYLFWKKATLWVSDTTKDYPPCKGRKLLFFSKLQTRIKHQKIKLTQAENEIANFNQMLDEFSEGLLILDAHHHILWMNKNAARLLELNAENDLMQSINNLLRQPEISQYLNLRDFSQDLIISNFRPKLSLKFSAYNYTQSECLLFIQDISKTLQTEVILSDFITNISHDLRIPLSVIMGSIETLKLEGLSAEQKNQVMQLIDTQSQRMLNLLNNLLNLSKLEAKPLPNFDEACVIQDLVQHLSQEAKILSANHVFKISLAENLSPHLSILGDEVEILNACSNLLNNAIRYTNSTCTIELAVQLLKNGDLEISINDNGQGIPKEHLHRITERFYRVNQELEQDINSKSSETYGSGLGLAIVKHTMIRHGGKLLIESKEGVGSKFKLIFPKARIAG